MIFFLLTTIMCVVRIIAYKRQIKSICHQLTFHKKHNLEKERRTKETINGLSHDIRTPLTSLDGYCQLLEECEDRIQRQKYLKIMGNRIDSLKNLIEELFLYTKLQNKSYELKIFDLDINQLVFDTLFLFYEDFTRNGIEPQIQLSETPVIIQGDETALGRVVQNIIKNALEHGCKDFSINLVEDNQKVILQFTNSYDNLEKIDGERIFEHFYKGDKVRKKTSTGLGLAIAKELVERMKGEISVEIDDTTFSVTIIF